MLFGYVEYTTSPPIIYRGVFYIPSSLFTPLYPSPISGGGIPPPLPPPLNGQIGGIILSAMCS